MAGSSSKKESCHNQPKLQPASPPASPAGLITQHSQQLDQKSLQELVFQRLGNASAAIIVKNAIPRLYQARDFIQAIDLASLAKTIKNKILQEILDSPIRTAIIIGGLLILLAPGIITVPLLNAFGFSAEGVTAGRRPDLVFVTFDEYGPHNFVAGSLASGIHAVMGNVPAASAFANFQSAAAGGTGIVVVNKIATTAGAVAVVAESIQSWARSSKL